MRNTERRGETLEVVTVEPTVTDITGGKRAEATFEIPDAWSGREVFDDAEGFAVPPASGAIWGTDQGPAYEGDFESVYHVYGWRYGFYRVGYG